MMPEAKAILRAYIAGFDRSRKGYAGIWAERFLPLSSWM